MATIRRSSSKAVTAVFAELPWIYFESPPGPITVRYGDPKLTAPRYDLEAARANLPASPNRAVVAIAAAGDARDGGRRTADARDRQRDGHRRL